MNMSEVYERFVQIVAAHNGTLLEKPYKAPKDQTAFRFTSRGKFLGVAAFPGLSEYVAEMGALCAIGRTSEDSFNIGSTPIESEANEWE